MVSGKGCSPGSLALLNVCVVLSAIPGVLHALGSCHLYSIPVNLEGQGKSVLFSSILQVGYCSTTAGIDMNPGAALREVF